MRNVILLFTALLIAGCSQGDFPVATVTGQVLCEGKAVPNVQVFFEPLSNGESGMVGKQGIATTDLEGKFVVSTYADRDGAVVGKHRVRVGPPREAAGSDCGCVLNSEIDVIQVNVKKDGTNDFALTLKKKRPNEKKSLEELEALEEARERTKTASTK